MKKILLIILGSFSMFSCSVDEEHPYIEGKVEPKNAITSGDECLNIAGEDNSRWIEISEASAIGSWDEVRKLYTNLLSPGVSSSGTFQPSIWEIIDQFHAQGLGDLTTTYTVTNGECSDSVTLTVTVVPDGYNAPTCQISAGPDNSISITKSEADALGSWDEVRNLYLSLLEAGTLSNGTFDPSIWDIINSYNGVGEYSTVYTVGEGDCTDSVNLTVVVVPDGQQTPSCDGVTAGPDNSKTIKESEAAAIGSWDEVRKMYLSLLAPGVSHNGTFDPAIWDIINEFQARRTGNFTTTYTVTEGDCTDSVQLTVTVIPG